MIETTTLITYVAIVLGFVFIPGPATLLTVARTTSSGARVGIATGTGIATGDIVHAFMAIVGISAIMAASATLFSIVKYIGAAYLVFLGLQSILTKTPVELNGARALPMTAQKAFRQGLITELHRNRPRLPIACFKAFAPST